MKLRFCGAAGTTTGSQHLLEVNGKRILLDCGLYQGSRKHAYDVNCCFPYFEPSSIDAVILSHAHIDHSGNLPNLSRKGFTGNIYSTDGTRDLCQIMLADSAHIQQGDIEWLNKHRLREGLPPVEPLYSQQDAEHCLRQFVTVSYDRPMYVCDGVKVTFIDAGHILGSAQVLLEIEDKADGRRKRFLFSGDVGRGGNEVLRDPVPVPDVDFVLMESTYGGREHEAPPGESEYFARLIHEALERGGKILIPAFAVERTQQILFMLHELFTDGRIPDMPVYVDSPLAVSATEIYRLHPECFNETVYETLFEKQNPFGFENLTLVRSVKGSMELNEIDGRAIIIAASGMCEAGRILHHLKNNIGDPRTTVLFVGYCADHTLGRRIRDGEKEVPILGSRYRVRAKIEAVDSFSGHADHSELLDWFARTGGPKEKVWLVHGEPDHAEALREALAARHSGTVEVARLGETVDF
ncbi:MBL fold metallo-hydrolase [Luteolibacter ambystomatis]|uniref:MBL fold metallo-hydrolase n=1 Tax=Luteolibacter ambystomatis TaxID=2824561 RepID=A0A975PG06_9BACT|nr:MBL fold metallo-hydrolase [Luteolibacter ambystomatis]QUE52210.1 MBL fold metallo-hydrolase [Luteolibacter ambystomatis]